MRRDRTDAAPAATSPQGPEAVRRREFLIASGASAALLGAAAAHGAGASTALAATSASGVTRGSARIPDDAFVMDSTVHVYNFSKANILESAGPYPMELAGMLYEGFMKQFSPRGQPQYIMPREWYYDEPAPNLERLVHALFAESQTDACIYHGLPNFGYFKDGGSPLWVGEQMRERWPGRVELYGPVSPWQADWRDRIDEHVEKSKVKGIKLYPMDLVDGEVKGFRLDDPQVAFPIIEYARKRGIRNVAFHKSIPFGRVPMDTFRVTDVDSPAIAFPDVSFEIVHGGFAFLEDTAWLVGRFPNVAINLEGGSGYLCNAPRRFAELLGTFLSVGGAERIYWSVGTVALHPQPFLDAFWNLEMPADLVEGYGLPPLTEEIKRNILGLNHAKALGFDVAAMRAKSAGDEFSKRSSLAPPWSAGA
jgi:hypothetical protein